MTGYINKLKEQLINEKNSLNFDSLKLAKQAQKQIVKVLQAIYKTRDIDMIMSAEKAINIHELQYYTNSKPMESSIKQTLTSIEITNKLIDVIHNKPDEYIIRAKSYEEAKNKIGDLPNDEARQFFKAQSTRFVNLSKAPLTTDKKATIEARKINIRLAGEIYTDMQKNVLGIQNTNSPKQKIISL